jgi:peptidoglycan hydrolase-like protein with peptidoglycan-binding domain
MRKYILGAFAATAVFAFVVVADAATYTRDLTIGSTGSDVVALQDMLIASGDLVMPAGVSKGYFGALTQSALAKWQAKMSISPAAGYFGPITRAKAEMAPSKPGSDDSSSDLSGGDGDIQDISETTSGTETTLGEGKTEDVVGFDLEADDNSDLEVTSVRVEIATEAGESSRLTRYLEEVAITLDGEVVGSVDASDFSRDGATSTATIALDDAMVEAGEEVRFYVTLTAAESINDSELDAELNVVVDRVRVEDASGAVLTEDVDNVSTTVDFEDATANDDARIKSDSATRDAGLLKVEENKSSEEFDVLTFKFDVDEDSSDLVVLEIPVEFSIDNGSTTGVLDVEDMIKDLWIEVDGEKYDDFDWGTNVQIAANATEVATATITIDEGDLEIAADDVVDAVVFVEFNEQDGNYSEGTTIEASVTGSDIVAENTEGDVFAVDGSASGEAQTLQISAASVDGFEWKVNTAGTLLDFYFTVTAEDEDFEVLTSSIASTTAGTATTSAGVLTKSTGDADSISGGFRVLDGDKATFRVRYTISGSEGTYKEVTITSVAGQEVPDEDQVSPSATIDLN